MRKLVQTGMCLVVAAFSASALDKEFTDQMMKSAKNIERDAGEVRDSLKPKQFNADDVRKKIDAMSADLTKLQELVNQFESTHPSLSAQEQADWKSVKEKVQLLEIFHNEKKTLAAGDIEKNRTMLRAHAKGVAVRAAKLQLTLGKLQRTPIS